MSFGTRKGSADKGLNISSNFSQSGVGSPSNPRGSSIRFSRGAETKCPPTSVYFVNRLVILIECGVEEVGGTSAVIIGADPALRLG